MASEQGDMNGLLQELGTLGQRLAAALKATCENEELRRESEEGACRLGEHMDRSIQAARESGEMKELQAQARHVVETARRAS